MPSALSLLREAAFCCLKYLKNCSVLTVSAPCVFLFPKLKISLFIARSLWSSAYIDIRHTFADRLLFLPSTSLLQKQQHKLYLHDYNYVVTVLRKLQRKVKIYNNDNAMQ